MLLSSKSFFEQEVKLNVIKNRLDFFSKTLKGSILHIGCADYPIYGENNLHLWLINNLFHNKQINEIDGYDVNKDTILLMKQDVRFQNTELFYEKPNKKYDFLLIPETIEHVDNINTFLLDILDLMNEKCEIIITGPNAFCSEHYNRNSFNSSTFVEVVHPDHNCWFSPYTLINVINKTYNKIKNINYKPLEVGLVENNTMVYVYFEINNIK